MERVLHVITKLDYGGVQQMILNHYSEIDKEKIQFDFVVQYDGNKKMENFFLKNGSRIYRAMPMHINRKEFEKNLEEILLENNYNIIHVHQNFLNIIPLRIAKKLKVKSRISHSHSFYPSQSLLNKFKRKISRKIINNYATELLSCSNAAGVWLYGSKNKFTVIKNGINVDRFLYNKKKYIEDRRENGFENKKIIIHVGTFTENKNQKFILDILEKYLSINPNIHLLLIGEGETKIACENYAEEKKISEHISFLGNKSNVEEYLNLSDVFILPSKFEGLGISLIEAQFNDLNCIISDTVPLESILFDKVKRLSTEQNIYDWIHEMEKMPIGNKQIIKEEILNNNEYSVKYAVNSLQKVYLKNSFS